MTFNYAEVEVVAAPSGSSGRTSRWMTSVPWGAEKLPARGSYTMSVHAAPVFDALPTSSDAHDRLSITYVVLVLHCSVCDDVKTVSDGGNTVFEVDGRFLQILEYRVKLAGVNSSFRKPPVFLKYAVSGAHERRQAFLEIEVLLDHPRFVTSNPSPSYIRSVVKAFRSERTVAKRILAVTAISVRRL